jgi:O-antigen ligase
MKTIKRLSKDQRKDLVAVLVICYCLPLCFWFGNCNGIRSKLDLFLFVGALTVMCIIPIFVFEYHYRRMSKYGL